MKWIKFFENFTEDSETLYFFDFDETLVNLPKLDHLIPDFWESEWSIPISTRPLATTYQSVKNKAIVTGRFERLRKIVEDSLLKFGLDYPNYELHCYPHEEEEGIPDWKAETIVKVLRETGFKKAKFFDDKSDWVQRVVQAVETELPEVEFEGIVAT
jgi:hypothetical protein